MEEGGENECGPDQGLVTFALFSLDSQHRLLARWPDSCQRLPWRLQSQSCPAFWGRASSPALARKKRSRWEHCRVNPGLADRLYLTLPTVDRFFYRGDMQKLGVEDLIRQVLGWGSHAIGHL